MVVFAAGAPMGGVWMAFVGWFLFTLARDEERRALILQALVGVCVADAMTAVAHTAPGWIAVEDFILRYMLRDRYVLRDRRSAYPVEDFDGSITGLITRAKLRGVTPTERATTLVRDVAIPVDQLPTAVPHKSP